MFRPAQTGDEPAIEAFLAGHAETSMFLRGNLRAHGLDERDAPHGTSYWLAEDDGEIAAVFGLTNAGFAMAQAPGAPAALYGAFAQAIVGRKVAGLTGAEGQVSKLRAALGLHATPCYHDAPEPLYRLDLANLSVPNGASALRPAEPGDRGLLEAWHRNYLTELNMASPEQARLEAKSRAERAIAGDNTRLLCVEDVPVARTEFNARLPDMVQIGGVYTPPDLRGHGYARRAVALHLAEVRKQRVKTAILAAAGPAACRAYEAIGFERIGAYALAILQEPVIVKSAS